MKILFVWRKYDGVVGGVERMSVALMNEMMRRGHNIALLSWDQAGAKSYYAMDPRIDWHRLDMGNSDEKAGWKLRIRRALGIRRHIREIKPDVVLAFMDGVFLSVKLSVLGLGIPVVEAERCSAARFEFLAAGRFVNLIFQSLRLAKNITVQLESYRRDYPAYLQEKIVCIPNPVFPAQKFASPSSTTEQSKTLLSVGRLSYQKNYSVLIKGFAKLSAEFSGWNLKIVGEGQERAALLKLISDLGLQDRVKLEGAVQDVQSLYAAAHLFCLPSRWEGFPNALAEALAHGLPSVGFQDCLGICDLIEDGKSGVLAKGMDNAETLADALRKLMMDDNARETMGHVAAQSMLAYKPEIIFDKWEEFFRKAMA